MKQRPALPVLGILGLVLFQSLEVYAVEIRPPRAVWEAAQFKFTPEVEAACLAASKDAVLKSLAATNKTLPTDFLAWVDSDPVVKTTVYGAREDASGILLWLRSLEIDLGQDVVRKKYAQLALAMAMAEARNADKADISPRAPLVLHIGGDPRKPVDTQDKNRALDLNDHIINFLNANTIEEDVVVGQKEESLELKYDDKGVAIPAPPRKGKPKMIPVTEKRTRTLYAADVIASRALQQKFNAYMKAHGLTNEVNCGDQVVHWKSRDMVRGEEKKNIAAAFTMFRTAYEAKGLLPEQRDPAATPAERCAYLIRNNEFEFPPDVKDQRKWPRFPLTAPWPVMTMLAENSQPLREREERWIAFRDKGETKTYGEYIGGIAQQFDMQSARRLTPFPFNYGTIQMMLKDGGVCGTMAGISVRTHNTLGVPASTAGQPGHCALVLFGFDPKTGMYNCHGAQYATAGDSGTGVHSPWLFGDVDARKPMVYHQSIAWAVNHGLQSFLDSTVAHTFYRQLPDADKKANGVRMLASAMSLNPYNFLLVDDALSCNAQPEEVIAFWKSFKIAINSAGKPGCPTNGLYTDTIKTKFFARLATLPVPSDKNRAEAILAFMTDEGCDSPAALASYKLATAGLPALLDETATAFTNHLSSVRSDASCETMADTLSAVAGKITDKKARAAWAADRWQEIDGKEMYLGRRNVITTDKSVPVLGKLAGKKSRTEEAQLQSLLDQIAGQFRTAVVAPRTPQECKQRAGVISAVAGQIKDADQKTRWLGALAQAIAGNEIYEDAHAKKNAKSQRDPCADTIAQLLNPPQKKDPSS